MVLPPLDTNTVLIVAAVIVAILIVLVIHLEVKLHRFLKGKNAASLEGTIMATDKEVLDLKKFNEDLQKYLTTVETRIKRGIQSAETVRFNAFRGTGEGGNQSFATAFLNEKGTGVIISTIYSRERTSVFAKPIENFTAQIELSDEERKVLEKAEERLK